MLHSIHIGKCENPGNSDNISTYIEDNSQSSGEELADSFIL